MQDNYASVNSSADSSDWLVAVVLATKGQNLCSLTRLFDSLSHQTFKNFELIVVYSEYSKELMEVCRAHNAIAIKEESNTLAAARNLGIKQVFLQKRRPNVVVFTDDDCELPEYWLQRINTIFQENMSIHCLGGPDLNPADASDKDSFQSALGSFEESPRRSVYLNGHAVNKIKGCNVAYRDLVFEKVGYLKESLKSGEDLEFHIRLVQNGLNLRFDPEVSVWHHRRETLGQSLKHLYKLTFGSAPVFASLRTLKYAKSEGIIAKRYVSILLPFLILAAYLLGSDFAQTTLFIILILLGLCIGYTVMIVRSLKRYQWKEICFIPILLVLTNIVGLFGFYSGLIVHVYDDLKVRKAVETQKSSIS